MSEIPLHGRGRLSGWKLFVKHEDAPSFGYRVSGLGFRVSGFGFHASGSIWPLGLDSVCKA